MKTTQLMAFALAAMFAGCTAQPALASQFSQEFCQMTGQLTFSLVHNAATRPSLADARAELVEFMDDLGAQGPDSEQRRVILRALARGYAAPAGADAQDEGGKQYVLCMLAEA